MEDSISSAEFSQFLTKILLGLNYVTAWKAIIGMGAGDEWRQIRLDGQVCQGQEVKYKCKVNYLNCLNIISIF